MKYYLLTMAGGGDTHVKLVTQEGWDAMDDGVFPPQLRADYHAQFSASPYNDQTPEQMDEEIDGFAENYGGGSPENDIALCLPCAVINGFVCEWHSVSDALKWLRANPTVEVESDWEGHIY